jgi:hypothetical protein
MPGAREPAAEEVMTLPHKMAASSVRVRIKKGEDGI